MRAIVGRGLWKGLVLLKINSRKAGRQVCSEVFFCTFDTDIGRYLLLE